MSARTAADIVDDDVVRRPNNGGKPLLTIKQRIERLEEANKKLNAESAALRAENTTLRARVGALELELARRRRWSIQRIAALFLAAVTVVAELLALVWVFVTVAVEKRAVNFSDLLALETAIVAIWATANGLYQRPFKLDAGCSKELLQ